MKDIKNFLFIAFGVDIVLIMIALYQGGTWLINSQLAFLSSLFITLASFYSYRKVVLKRVEQERDSGEEFDEIEKIEDPFDLYSEEVSESKDLQEVIKEERAKLITVKQTGENLAKTLSGAFSPYRLLSYLFLFLSFLYLVNNKLFEIWAYMSGLVVVSIATMIFAWRRKG